ncbi:DUF3145 domain-containing protein [Brachybacterium sp. DNPG3]
MTQGVLHIHSAPRALTPHIEWAASGVLGMPLRLRWEEQPVGRALLRAETGWQGREGTGAHLASALRGLREVRFEIVQHATATVDGSRWCCTPELGIHHAVIDHAGNTMLTEDHVRACMERCDGDPRDLPRQLGIALGEPWDEELEIYRHAAEGAPMRWLHRVG